MEKVLRGLHQAHKQGIIHRDIKPSNILLEDFDEGELTNVRLITATDADLLVLCEQEQFKKPLLYRLNCDEIKVPTLAQRAEDIGLLLLYFAEQKMRQLG